MAVLRGANRGEPPDAAMREAVYAEWLTIAIPREPGDPFERADFDRPYEGRDGRSGGLAKALARIAADPPVTAGGVEWAMSTMSTPGTPRVGPCPGEWK